MTEVHILMGIRNGAAYLPEQLDSLARQTHNAWRLTCSDDGSTDGSQGLVRSFAATVCQRVEVIPGPRQGFAENFLSLVRNLPDETGPIAFADQDDLWLAEKLERALSALPSDVPALYGAATFIWTPNLNRQEPTAPMRRPPCFANALVENYATGNTMVLNAHAARVLRDASRRVGPVYAHDWWAYALLSGIGARLIYDPRPCLLYRQHQSNEIGAGETFWKRQRRNLAVGQGLYRKKVGQNLAALGVLSDSLTAENRSTLARFAAARDRTNPISRAFAIWQSGVFRQSYGDMAGFLGAGLLGKV